MGKMITRIPSSHLLISSLLSKPHDSTSALKALPGKVDIKRHSPSILYQLCIKSFFNPLPVSVRWALTKMVPKIAATCLFALVDTLNQSFDTWFLSNLIYYICSKLLLTFQHPHPFLPPPHTKSLNMGFVQWMLTKMAMKMAATCPFAFVDTLN